MSVESRYRMSQERLEELKKELEYLQTVREKEVSEQIKEARSFGDLSENSEYDEAKTEQGKLYSKIAEIKNLIENAVILENVPTGSAISMGSRVTVREVGEEMRNHPRKYCCSSTLIQQYDNNFRSLCTQIL